MDNINIRKMTNISLLDFLLYNNYSVEKCDNGIYKVEKEEELPVFMMIDNNNIYFEVDLGNISAIESKELYFKFLDLNSEILPVSIAFDTTNKDDIRLVLVESREMHSLDDNEILSVFTALEVASDKVEILLSEYMS